MKFNISFKTPDAAHYALQDIDDEHKDKAEEIIGKFVRYGEYVDIEFDTETGEAKVLRA